MNAHVRYYIVTLLIMLIFSGAGALIAACFPDYNDRILGMATAWCGITMGARHFTFGRKEEYVA